MIRMETYTTYAKVNPSIKTALPLSVPIANINPYTVEEWESQHVIDGEYLARSLRSPRERKG